MRKAWSVTTKSGFSLVEVIVASAVFLIIVAALGNAVIQSQGRKAAAGSQARAIAIAEEGMDATRNIRDAGFANLTDGTHGLAVSSNQWVFSGASDIVDAFTRSIAIGTIDTNTKRVTSTVTWLQNTLTQGRIDLVTYMTNWLKNAIGNWVLPVQESTLNLTDAPSGGAGLKIQVQGNYAYLVRNNASVNNFAVIDISNTASPVQVGALNLTGAPTNIFVSGSYAYVSSSNTSQELQIVNISTPASPTLSGTYNATGAVQANSVYVSGTTAYLTTNTNASPEFYIVNVTTPASPTLIGSLNLNGNINDVFVSGTNALVVSSQNTQEIQVIDITTPATPTLTGSVNLTGNNDGTAITGFGTNYIIGRANGDFYIYSGTPIPTQTGTVNIGSAINDISLGNSNTYAFLATGSATIGFRVIDITTLSAPVSLGTLNVGSLLNGIAYDSTFDRAFCVSTQASSELIIVAPS